MIEGSGIVMDPERNLLLEPVSVSVSDERDVESGPGSSPALHGSFWNDERDLLTLMRGMAAVKIAVRLSEVAPRQPRFLELDVQVIGFTRGGSRAEFVGRGSLPNA